MYKKLISFFTFLLCAHLIFAQARLVEKVTKTNTNEVVIPYEKYVLPNGFTIIVHEDHSDPVCHVDVTYHVGSAREEIGKSGFAHFFEHMMFQGSDNVADEQHFKIITEAGGTLNGTTNRDRTNYFETVPSNQLEKMLWLEADRMGFLLDAVTQQKFEVQRATVKNERGQNYDNRPYGLVQEFLAKNLFPYGHPYSWLTIGYIEDLNRVNVNDLKNFFLRWYGPNNAVLTVGGDVNTKEVVKLAEKYFGSIPQCPKVEKTVLPSPVLDKNRYVSMTDQYAKLPMLQIALPTVPAYHNDEPAMDCLAEILGGDNNSILYQNLVKTQKAISASAFHPTDELAGMLQISITPKPGTPLADIEKEVRNAIEELAKNKITEQAVAKFKNSHEASMIYRMESVSGKVSQLAAYHTFTGNANYIINEQKRYKQLTTQDVINAYNKYVKGKPMVVVSVLTKGNEQNMAAPDNYTVEVNPAYKAPNYGYDNLKYVKAKDNFDRSKMPVEKAPKNITVPEFKKIEEDNMKMMYSYSNEIPVVAIQINMKGGRMYEQNELDKVGMSNIFASMMNEDTKLHTAEELSAMLDNLGSSVNVFTDLDETGIRVRCLKKNLDATMDIVMERIMQPLFKKETFDRIQNQVLENIKNSKTRAATMASNLYQHLMFSAGSVSGIPSSGTEITVKNITLNDIENCYKNYINRNDMNVIVVGDLTEQESKKIFNKLKMIPTKDINVPAFTQRVLSEPRKIYFYDIPKAAQTEFRVGFVTNLKYDDLGEYFKATLMNFPIGGAFNCRLNINLREDKGWTYGARAGFSGNDYTGTYTFSSGIKAAATDSALYEVMKEFNLYFEKGVDKDEIDFMKKAITQSDARKYETLGQKAGFLSNILKYNLQANYVNSQMQIIQSMDKPQIDQMIKKWLRPDAFHILLVGDYEKTKAGLQRLGYPIVLIDEMGNVKN